ncbi:MAG: LTA synthase family protein [Thermoanaerobaculia bacterium]
MKRLPILFFAANLLLLTTLRVAFYFAFRRTAGAVEPHELVLALYLGLKFDARWLAILTFPLLFLRRGTTVYAVVVETLLLLLYAADFASYAYIQQRINAQLLEFLRNPVISLHMVWESYHVVLFGLTILAVVTLLVWSTTRTVKSTARKEAGTSWLLSILLLACIYGKVSRYPLRWSDAYFSHNRFAGELALNPAQYLFETMREKPAAYNEKRLRLLYPLVAEYLRVDHPNAQTLEFGRTPPLHPMTSGSPNIVLIQLESLAAYKCGMFGNLAGGSPNLDALAREGLLFTQHYSPSEKTARALFAVIFGIPDVSPWQASAHNPLTVDQTSIAGAFKRYERFYFLGGSANWSNIRGMLAHNLEGLRIYEEGSYGDAPVVDVWGVSDEDVLLKANQVLAREERPFFAILHTSGNHRPFTIPKQTHGFSRVTLSDEVLHANHFESNEELNSFRYLDHAVGLFFAAARKERYFANTIFVLYGDHGTRIGAPGEWMSLGDLSPIVYHVPMIIYAPAIIREPRRVSTPSSHVDILPTVASIAGTPYVDRTLGIDVLDPQNARRSSAFIFTTFHDPPDLELIDPLGTSIIRHDDRNPNLAGAMYEASRWMLYHNH